VLAIAIGTGAGFASIGFRRLISFMGWIFHDGIGGALESGIGVYWTIPVLALGGLLVGLITKFFAPETKGHGVPEVMLAVAFHGGRIRPRVAIFKALAAAICIGSGGSAGREGPIVQIGSAFGSAIAQWFKLPDRRVTLSVACGAAAGVAATFNAPIAGVIFAMEVILRRFTSRSFVMVVLSAVTASVVSRSFGEKGDAPEFAVLEQYGLTSIWEGLTFALLGIVGAVVAQLYIRSLYAVEDVADKVKVPEWVKPGIGGAAVGAMGIYASEIFGTGYGTIESALNGEMVFSTLAILCVLKIVATSLTIGSGGSGGVFAPSLFIGAMYGGAFGSLVNQFLPEHLVSHPGAYALVGMAAVFTGSAHAPITAILILFEMTGDYGVILPLMFATVLSTFTSQLISQQSIYTIKLQRRGINIGAEHDVNLMDAITVREAMDAEFNSVSPKVPLTGLAMKLATEHVTGYAVIDDNDKLVGIVTMQDVENAFIDRNPDSVTVNEICTKNVVVCRPDQTLSTALELLGARNVGRLPVIDPHNPDKVIGVLHRADIIRAYTDAYGTTASAVQRVDQMRGVSEGHEMTLEQDTITVGGKLAGMLVRDANFPPGATLGTIRRGHETLMPRGSTEFRVGDLIVVVSTRNEAGAVKKWLRENC
jgi:CIC family chloride channel protein